MTAKSQQVQNIFQWPSTYETLQESFPATPAPLPYHYAMIKDQRRVGAFRDAFQKHLQKTDRVLEIGGGTGILSLLAEPYCKSIISVEKDLSVAKYGKSFIKQKSEGKIEYLTGDIRNYRHLGRFDAIICEVMDTAFISEAQIPLINYSLKYFLKPNGKIFPKGSLTMADLIHKDYVIEGLGDFPLPHYEAYGLTISEGVTDKVVFHKARFDQICPERYSRSITFKATKSGEVNSVRFYTQTEIADEIFIDPTEWLNPLMVIPLERSIFLNSGEELTIKINYVAGRGLDHVTTQIQ